MKKIFALLLAVIMVLSLCACDNQNSTPADPATEAPTQAPTETPTEAPTQPPAAKGIDYSDVAGVWVARVDLKELFEKIVINTMDEQSAEAKAIEDERAIYAKIPDGELMVDWYWQFNYSPSWWYASAKYDEEQYKEAYLGLIDAYLEAAYVYNLEQGYFVEDENTNFDAFYKYYYEDTRSYFSSIDLYLLEFSYIYNISYKCADGKLYINTETTSSDGLTEEDVVQAVREGNTLTIKTPVKGGNFDDRPICEYLFPLSLQRVQ